MTARDEVLAAARRLSGASTDGTFTAEDVLTCYVRTAHSTQRRPSARTSVRGCALTRPTTTPSCTATS